MKERKQKTADERFWSMVQKLGPEECWPWKGHRDKDGYGRIGFKKPNGKWSTMPASRMAYILSYGHIPEGALVLHKCDNPPCCNAAHLFTGTHLDNMRDKCSKGREAKGDTHGYHTMGHKWKRGDLHHARLHPENVLRGDRHGFARLTEANVAIIKRRLHEGEKAAHLSREYGVSPSTIELIGKNKTWVHVKMQNIESADSESNKPIDTNENT